MTANGAFTALGLMSGTSMDGIDAAIIVTDGARVLERGPALSMPYDAAFRDALRGVLGRRRGPGEVAEVERAITAAHAAVVEKLLADNFLPPEAIDVAGFHGHTILHEPARGRTWQIGDGARLARQIGIDVVNDFRRADVEAGGQGAPFAPLFHAALAADLERPLCVLNIGGVGNVTWLGEGALDIVAFDTGPGNALIDDWARRHTGQTMDEGGALASAGTAHRAALAALLEWDYLDAPPPKSLDRLDFGLAAVAGLSAEDGAATLVEFTAAAAARGAALLPSRPSRWLVTGGGRRNPAIMAALARRLEAEIVPVEAVGWQGDLLEAQAFAFLAVRSLKGMPLSLPRTTGVARPTPGGTLHKAR
jgi:anhydro-N-acetylmuramic acid kinase